MKEYILGIDLGTTNSCVSVIEGGEPVVIPSSEGSRTIPSVVAWKKSGERIVGITAKRGAVVDPKNTIYSAKRLMGHKYSEVKQETNRVPYIIKENDKKMAVIEVPVLNKTVTPEEVSAAILQKCKTDAEAYLGQTVTKAVITCPAYFTEQQRHSIKSSAEIAGLDCLRIINEPTAAALAYGLDKNKDEIVFVYDLGGGTFDVSLLQISDGVFEVLASNGDSQLGGDDFDQKIVDWIIAQFKSENGIDLSKDVNALSRIKEAAEKAKIELSSQLTTNINLPFITAMDNQPIHLSLDLSRSKFESLVQDLLERIKNPIKTVLQDGLKGDKSKIDEVILVGGSSRIPCCQTQIKEMIGIEPNRSVNPDEAVALGAAAQAGVLGGDVKDIILLDITPLSLSVEVNGGLCDVLISKNTTIPTQRKNIYTTATRDQSSVTINVLQGERPLAKDNKSLGMFNLDGIPPAPQGIPKIEVSFDIDANGLLSVTAKDLGTNKEQKITITQSGTLTDEEVEQMIKEAEQYAEQDKEAKDLILSKNELESLTHSIRSTIEDVRDKVDESLIVPVQEAIAKAEIALKDGSKESIEQAKTDLLTASHPLGEKLYENKQEAEPVEAEVVA